MRGTHQSVLPIACLLLVAGCAEAPLAPSRGPAPPAFANGGRAYLPGEQQPTTDGTRGITYAIGSVATGQVLAQTFTPSSNQWLGYLKIPVGCSPSVLLNVKIREGIDGPVLYESNHAGLPTAVSDTFQLLQVFDPAVKQHGIKLHKNHVYAFELAAFPGDGASETTGLTCGILVGPATNSYAGGRGYWATPSTGQPFLPLPAGQSTDDEDLPFVTLVR
jgi:hypothetical protein